MNCLATKRSEKNKPLQLINSLERAKSVEKARGTALRVWHARRTEVLPVLINNVNKP